ncbi:hypothetical protein FRC03_009665 [Tulasnella sp. 419]|nr:hypothetical protein FRC03_009665 [Tulasnella sp. 419]
MMQCRKEAKDASRRGDYVVANKLNLKGQMHEGNMERLNSRASEIIYKENNRGRMLGLIDLHGLYVREALERTAEAIEAALGRGDVEIKIIVGKGNRSRDAIAKLKPEVQAWLLRHNFPAKLDAPGGMFIVDLRGQIVDEHLHEIVYDQTSDDGCDEMF